MKNKNLLIKEISGVLLVKAILLGLLWWLCFSQPQDVNLDAADIGQHVFSPPAIGKSL